MRFLKLANLKRASKMAKDTKKSKKPANPMTQDETYRKLPKNSKMVDAKDIDQPYYDMSPKTEAQRMGAARRNRERAQDEYFKTLSKPELKNNSDRAARAARNASAEEKIAAQQAGYQYNPATESMDFEGNVKQYRKGGMVKEKGTGEKYASNKAMMKHERKESPAMERSEYRKGGAVMCRGGGLVTRKRPTKVC